LASDQKQNFSGWVERLMGIEDAGDLK